MNYSLLPSEKTYSDSLWIFLAPYIVYVGSNLLIGYISLWFLYVIKIILVASIMFYFRKSYRFGKWNFKNISIGILATPLLVFLWILPLYYSYYFSGTPLPQNNLQNTEMANYYWLLHTFAATLFVPVFEELFCRVYLLEFLYQSSLNTHEKNIADKLNNTMDKHPQDLKNLKFNLLSLIGVLLFFTIGHSSLEYVSCILYFGVTQIIYRFTGSLCVCIVIHALTNLSIAFFVRYCQWEFLWF